jgi:hypothetical protein
MDHASVSPGSDTDGRHSQVHVPGLDSFRAPLRLFGTACQARTDSGPAHWQARQERACLLKFLSAAAAVVDDLVPRPGRVPEKVVVVVVGDSPLTVPTSKAERSSQESSREAESHGQRLK